MKFKTKTIATLLSSTALATMIGMGSAYAEDKDEDPGTGAPQEEQPQGDGVAPSTGMGGALQEEKPRTDDMAPPAGQGEQAPQRGKDTLPEKHLENMGDGNMGHDNAGKEYKDKEQEQEQEQEQEREQEKYKDNGEM